MARLPEPTPVEELNARYAYGFPLWTPRRSGDRRILVSDPWGFVRYALATMVTARARQARAFWDQAEDFYWAAEECTTSAKPLLYYYSFMNMVKAFLIRHGSPPKDIEVHGIRHRRPARKKSWIQTQELLVEVGSADRTSLFHEFALQLGHNFQNGERLKVGEVLQQIVGVHRAWMSVTGNQSNFALAEVSVHKDRNSAQVLGRIRFSVKDKAVAESVAGLSGWRRIRSVDPSSMCFETQPEARQGRSYQSAVESLTKRITDPGLHLLLTETEGYRLYFSDFGRNESKRLPQLVAMYAAMFFLGAITRYRPYDFDRYVAGKWGWLVNEFINSQPAQFVYLLTSEIVGNEVVLPLGNVTIRSV